MESETIRKVKEALNGEYKAAEMDIAAVRRSNPTGLQKEAEKIANALIISMQPDELHNEIKGYPSVAAYVEHVARRACKA